MGTLTAAQRYIVQGIVYALDFQANTMGYQLTEPMLLAAVATILDKLRWDRLTIETVVMFLERPGIIDEL